MKKQNTVKIEFAPGDMGYIIGCLAYLRDMRPDKTLDKFISEMIKQINKQLGANVSDIPKAEVKSGSNKSGK